ncbi:hypothetical protein BDW74DRAFT_173849 [Aspergillus multicolor]|uniref:uncharacterized protein n=1 Tax=Aspergillus multicolor TaxID=41759 RepID=UPI003CCE2C14
MALLHLTLLLSSLSFLHQTHAIPTPPASINNPSSSTLFAFDLPCTELATFNNNYTPGPAEPMNEWEELRREQCARLLNVDMSMLSAEFQEAVRAALEDLGVLGRWSS